MTDSDDVSRSLSDPESASRSLSEPESASRSLSERSETKRPGTPDEPEVFPPTLREVMLRPRWIGMLLLCLAVAGVFAWLGQWQLARAVQTNPVPPGATEQVEPLGDVVAPGEYLPEPLVGQRVETSGTWVPGDFLVVESRFNDGVEGYWVTGQLRLDPAATGTDEPTSIAVGRGGAPPRGEAQAAGAPLGRGAADAVALPVTVTGRIISDEGPVPPSSDGDPQSMRRMSPAALLGQWHDVEGLNVYRPYLLSDSAPGELVDISSPAPEEGSGLNWLNIFYALEWAVFAGFAFYLWYRLAKDAWEKELEDLEDADSADGAAESRG